MDWLPWVVAGALALPAFFAWSALHEVSHYLAARLFRRVVSVRFRIYPHVDPVAGFRWAAVEWEYEGEPYAPAQDAFISAAPRIPDLVAVLLTPLAAAMPEPWLAAAWAVLVGAGLVDLAVGSIGWSEHSDLQRFARLGGHDLWTLRVAGWAAALGSAGTTVGLLLARWSLGLL